MGGVVVKKDITQDSNSHKWDGGQLGIVIEFESKIAAKRAFYSDVFQKSCSPPKIHQNQKHQPTFLDLTTENAKLPIHCS